MSFRLIYLARRNPAVPFDEWPRTWRSHAVYVSQFPAMGVAVDRVIYCARMADVPAGYAREYDGVALVDSASKETLRGSMAPDVRALVDTDELRVFSKPVDDFSLYTDEIAACGAGAGQAAVIRFLARKPEMTRAAFDARLARDAPVAEALASPRGPIIGHTHSAVIEEPPAGYPFDAVTVSWFATPDAALAAASGGAFAAIERDLSEFRDAERSVDLLTRVIHRWPREG